MNKDWLYEKYITENMDCVQIGRLVDRDAKTVWYWLKKHSIPTRPRGSNYRQNLNAGRPAGYHHSDVSKRKISTASRARGAVPHLRNGQHWLKTARPEDNPKWRGGITPERQTFYRSPEWKASVKAVWKRDNATCQRCGLDHRMIERSNRNKFHIHHIVSFAVKELRCNPDNLILLCRPCHLWVHSSKNIEGKFIRDYSDAVPAAQPGD